MKNFEYELIRSQRKTIAIEINERGNVIVRANYKTPKKYIDKIVSQHENWILKKIKVVKEKNLNRIKREYKTGETFPFMGKDYPLEIISDKKDYIKFNDKFYMTDSLIKYGKSMFIELYKQLAKRYIFPRVEEISKKYNFDYNSIKITNAEKRWGSCSTQKTLNFSYKLIMTPKDIIDYVIVHELCHLKEPNHSKGFWNLVENIMPDYRERLNWLNKNSSHFTLG